jgi:hypothetical protein
MKNLYRTTLALLIVWCAILFLALGAKAQTVSNTTPAPSWVQALWTEVSPLTTASNYSFSAYGTYAPDIKAKIKFGGGLLAVFNVNDYVGVGVGGDYLRRFTLLSANATLKYPIHPLSFLHNSFGTNFAVVPFELIGGGASLSGASPGGIGVMIQDTGAYFQFGHLWGGQFAVGGAYGQWMNAGDYSGKRYHGFLSWSKGF